MYIPNRLTIIQVFITTRKIKNQLNKKLLKSVLLSIIALLILADTPVLLAKENDKLDIDFVGTTFDGEKYLGKNLLGKIILLDFFAIWCGPCIDAFPVLNRLNTDLNDNNFEVVSIALYSGTVEDVMGVIGEHNLNFTMVIGDGDEIANKYRVIGYPTYALIGPEGKIRKKYVGARKDFYDAVSTDVKAINSELTSLGEIDEK